jgi:hypothetical protein
MVENIQTSILEAQPALRQVRLACHRGRPHSPSESGRGLLCGSFPSSLQTMPHAQECQGEGWYDDATWTWGDYFDELSYVTYETAGG